jgi:hypothetical protein
MNMKWTEYDPEWLAVLAEAQVPEESWLPAAIRACTRHSVESNAYYRFVSPENANQPGAEWQFDQNIILQHPKEGMIVLDVLKGHRVGGVEFVDRL